MTDKEKLREIKIEQEPTQVTWRRCTQCNAAQMEFQLRENGICEKCYISNLEKENAELKETFSEEVIKNLKENTSVINSVIINKLSEKCEQLEKENEELNRDKTELVNSVTELENKVTELEKENKEILEDNDTLNKWIDELKAQIEKMKCCQNCKYLTRKLLNCKNIQICKVNPNNIYGVCDIWELAE